MREEGKGKLRRIKTLLIRDSLSSLELEFGLCWKSHNWHGGEGREGRSLRPERFRAPEKRIEVEDSHRIWFDSSRSTSCALFVLLRKLMEWVKG